MAYALTKGGSLTTEGRDRALKLLDDAKDYVPEEFLAEIEAFLDAVRSS